MTALHPITADRPATAGEGERERFAAWAAQESAEFAARYPKAPAWQVRDAGIAFAQLMTFNAKRKGL